MAECAARERPIQTEDTQMLVTQYLPFVRLLAGRARRALGFRVEMDDLEAYGVLGLLEAFTRYDPRAGANFMTFAAYRIRGAMHDGARRLLGLTRNLRAWRDEVGKGESCAWAVTCPGPEQWLNDKEERQNMRAALNEMPARDGLLLRSYYLEELSLEDAAARVGLTKSGASRAHARALKRMARVSRKMAA